MGEDLTRLNNGNFANRVHYLLLDSIAIPRNWGFYMCDPEMDHEQELRNKLTAIWIRALVDSIEGEQRYLREYRAEAERRGFRNLVLLCDRMAEYFACVRDLLARFTKEEQIVLFHIRNFLVHGWVSAEHSGYVSIKYFGGKGVAVERLTREQYWNLKREVLGQLVSGTTTIDHVLTPLRERFRGDSKYWALLGTVLSQEFEQVVQRGIAMDLGLGGQ